GNICAEYHTTKGDIERGFSVADVVVEREYRTQCIEHMYMETECAIAMYNGREVLVYGPAHYIFRVQEAVSRTLGLDMAHVRIIQSPIGGSYGGKRESMELVSSLAALASYCLGRTVKVELSPEESMHISSKRHPFILQYKAGMKKDGTFTAIKIRNVGDTGPYPVTAASVLFRAHARAPGPYTWQNWKIDSYMVRTNNAFASAMRGYGSPQVTFATESVIDELANEIGMDPIDIRLKNAFDNSSVTMTEQPLNTMPVNLSKALRKVREISGWDNKRLLFAHDNGRYRRGIGVASSWRGCSFGGEGYDWGSAILTFHRDGTLTVSAGMIEIGQGTHAVMAQIAAEVLGLTPDKINYVNMETSLTPNMLPTSASRATMIGGYAVKKAAEELRNRFFKHASRILNTSISNLDAKNNLVFSRQDTNKKITYRELASLVFISQEPMTAVGWYYPPAITWNPVSGKGSTYFTFHWMAQVFEVTVDTERGTIKIDHVFAVHDPGTVLNPEMARGQIIGALSWGIGFALHEKVSLKNGEFMTHGLSQYKILRAKNVPSITIEMLDIADPYGPYGAKSIGEPGLDLAGAGIANAVANAIGARIRELPLEPAKVLDSFNKRK
ncbi:MAG: xanthine dehydrogenase family protein molybdopterin-binding subunit, partial [Candidatus Ranarchaeia archaeon]